MNDEKVKKTSVLIIDDKVENLHILLNYLYKADFEIFIAQDGESALNQLKFVFPDIILLDIIMPAGIDGFETCRRLKENETTKNIPVIFMSALSETVDKVHGFNIGGVDYITKPFQLEEVLARMKTHLTLQFQINELQKLNALKDIFFSIISHDLRSPFQGLISGTEIFLQDFETLNKEIVKNFIRQINASSINTFNLLNNLLEWSKSQIGGIVWAPMKIDLYNIVIENFSLSDDNAKDKNVNLINELSENTFAYADKNMLNCIIRNLITNALKFTPSGGKVSISSKNIDDFIEIIVLDTGIGIKENDIKKLFNIAIHHTKVGTNGEKGSGLGLILCKEFVEKNGGQICVESQFGYGSVFRFTLPSDRRI